MNEQEIRKSERTKIVGFIRAVATDLRRLGNGYDAKFLDEIIFVLTSPEWDEDTMSRN